jgi:heme/copper-type cytochrome/quinol oxidase subunit 2
MIMRTKGVAGSAGFRGGAFLRGLVLLLFAAGPLLAETVTLPVAASVNGAGGVPFVSDVRVFNTSYTDVLTVTAVYRFNGAAQTFQLAAREAKPFDDICLSLFGTPNSLGAVEFTSAAAQGTLVVSSQLRSPVASGGFVGMFIPGLAPTDAGAVTVLTALVNGDSRTNVGVYNPNANAVTATIRLFDGPVFLGSTSFGLAGHATTQINNIYGVVGFASLVRTNGYATVESSDPGSPLFTFAAEADNRTGDLVLIVGAKDVAAPPGFNPPTATAVASLPSATPTPPAPTATPTPTAPAVVVIDLVATQFQWNFSGPGAAGSELQARVGQTYQLQIRDGDRAGTIAHGFGGLPDLGISAQSLTAGGAVRTVVFTPNSSQIGTHFFACDQPSCGTGHNNMLGTIRVSS